MMNFFEVFILTNDPNNSPIELEAITHSNALRKTNNLLTGVSLARNSIKAINTFNQCNKGR